MNNEFDSPGQTLQPYVEQNASMMQQLATAKIQSRYAIAARFPRDPMVVRERMLKQCDSPNFYMPDESKNGSSVAVYKVPRGGNTIEGVTIRFAEMAMRAHGNMSADIIVLGEDGDKALYEASCTDYENNVTHTEIVGVSMLIQRNYVKDTDTVRGERLNSKGKPVFTIVGTEDDIQMKRNALFSKAKRNLILAQLDQGLVEECKTRLKQNAAKKDAEDPEGAKKRLFDGFNTLGVTAADLAAYLGHSNKLTPAELADLRGYYSAIANGYATWRDILAEKAGEGKEDTGEAQAKQDALDKLFTELAMTAAQVRNTKAKYVNRPEELLKYLQEQVAKKANDGGAKVETAKPSEAKPEQKKEAPTKTQEPEPQPEPETENLDAEPEPEPTLINPIVESKPEPPKKEAPKKAPVPQDEDGW